MSKILSAKELRKKNKDQLEKMLKEKREKSRHLRFQISSNQVKNHRESRFLKREIARISTILTEGSAIKN